MSSTEEYLRRLKEANDRVKQRRKEQENDKNSFFSGRDFS